MVNKMICVLAGYDHETSNHLERIQNTLFSQGFKGTQTNNIPMHVTLGSYPTDMETEVIKLTEAVAAKTKEVEVCFSHVGIFGGSKVLFIAPDTTTALIQLQQRFRTDNHWTPHTTMLIDEPQTIYQALPYVADQFTSFKGKITSLHVYEFWPTRHILSVPLCK